MEFKLEGREPLYVLFGVPILTTGLLLAAVCMVQVTQPAIVIEQNPVTVQPVLTVAPDAKALKVPLRFEPQDGPVELQLQPKLNKSVNLEITPPSSVEVAFHSSGPLKQEIKAEFVPVPEPTETPEKTMPDGTPAPGDLLPVPLDANPRQGR